MSFIGRTVAALACLAAAGLVQAADAFQPETLTVEARIKPGANLFVLDQRWNGASRLNVMSVDDLSSKGLMSIGLLSQFTLSKDRRTAWAVSSYPRRIMYGAQESVLQEFDVATLSLKREVIIPEKAVLSTPQTSFLRLTADERYALLQNATPASSVSVVDLKTGTLLVEVPTPGCWGIFPATSGLRFSSLCGDGTLASYQIAADGKLSAPVKSEKFFDADRDPVYVHAERIGQDWLFLSFNGNLLRMTDAQPKARLVSKFSITEGVAGQWAPGGAEVMAYNPSHQVLFVAMHPDAKEGSHKDRAKEVWAVDLKKQKLLSRSVVEGVNSLTVTEGVAPVLFGMNDEGDLQRYEVDPEAKFAAKLSHKATKVGENLLGATGGAL